MSNNTGLRSLGPKRPKRAVVNSAAASITAITNVDGGAINIISMSLSGSAAGMVTFNSNATEIGRTEYKAMDPPMVLGSTPDAWMECVIGEDFKIGNASLLTLSGFITYVEI